MSQEFVVTKRLFVAVLCFLFFYFFFQNTLRHTKTVFANNKTNISLLRFIRLLYTAL